MSLYANVRLATHALLGSLLLLCLFDTITTLSGYLRLATRSPELITIFSTYFFSIFKERNYLVIKDQT